MYGALAGVMFAPALHIGSLYSTPELALVCGNIVSYFVSPKTKVMLAFREKREIAKDTDEYIFESDAHMPFTPGQYLEFTLDHEKPDSRGNRRYFTIASSPTEASVDLGVKFYEKGSSFKKALEKLKPGDVLSAGSLAGDFVMPHNQKEKLVFIAGGIGVTPYRSMVQYMLDTKEKRDVVLLYSAKAANEFAYTELFAEAEKRLGMKTVYSVTGDRVPEGWRGKQGILDAKTIESEIPDWRERTYYISGPHGMVEAFKKSLRSMGIPGRNVKVDFFPGFA